MTEQLFWERFCQSPRWPFFLPMRLRFPNGRSQKVPQVPVLLPVHAPQVPRGPAHTQILWIVLPGRVVVIGVHLHTWDGPLMQQMVIGGTPFLARRSRRKFSKTIKASKLHLHSAYGTALDATEATRSRACCSHAAYLPSCSPPTTPNPSDPSPAPSAAPHRHQRIQRVGAPMTRSRMCWTEPPSGVHRKDKVLRRRHGR